ncbi:MAG TPA: type II toxin-antitoxin system RelE/ParE family toxin [Tepidisphaeraceae bacterium]|jgi:plasmid stabilization system protein ParE|nr:type II toxin-antitoxin system RelE/ParE family toxin [Tepidisphaeraceae bacterium]
MSRYRIRPRAERDLIEHFAHIARDNIVPADRFLKVAEESFVCLSEMPRMGRIWDSPRVELQGVRVYPMPAPYRSYLIFYRLADNDEVDILAVLHAARDLEATLHDIL